MLSSTLTVPVMRMLSGRRKGSATPRRHRLDRVARHAQVDQVVLGLQRRQDGRQVVLGAGQVHLVEADKVERGWVGRGAHQEAQERRGVELPVKRVVVAEQVACVVPIGLHGHEQVVLVFPTRTSRRRGGDRGTAIQSVGVEPGQAGLAGARDARQDHQRLGAQRHVVGADQRIGEGEAARVDALDDRLDRRMAGCW